jgi:hypothetical protein
MVWIEMLANDNESAARRAADSIRHPRIRHFHDPRRLAGQVIAESLGAPGETAWDTYLFYAKSSEWREKPPVPVDWAHQNSEGWDPAHFAWDGDLRLRLEEICERLEGNS